MMGLSYNWRQERSLTDLEEKLQNFVIAHGANSVEGIKDPDARAEAHFLEQQVATERARLQLLAKTRAMANLAKAHAARRAGDENRKHKYNEAMLAKMRFALAQTHGNKSAAARLLGVGRNTVVIWAAKIAEADAALPKPTCALCGQHLPSLERPNRQAPSA